MSHQPRRVLPFDYFYLDIKGYRQLSVSSIHRKEGDEHNARYCYHTAGTTNPIDQSIDKEWRQLVAHFADN